MIGALAWMFFMWRYHRFRRGLLEDPSAAKQLDDERVRDLRRESIHRSWFVLVVATGVGVAGSALTDLPAQPILLALLLIAVEAPLVFFLCLDRG